MQPAGVPLGAGGSARSAGKPGPHHCRDEGALEGGPAASGDDRGKGQNTRLGGDEQDQGRQASPAERDVPRKGIPIGPKPTVGELRVLLRSKVVETGMSTMEMTIGKHKGKTYQEIMFTDEQYCHWAVKEVSQSSGPDWRLVRFARWCEKTFNDEMESDNDEWTPVTMPTAGDTNTAIKVKAIASASTTMSPMADLSGEGHGTNSQATNNEALESLKQENKQLKDQMTKMEKMLSEVIAEKKSKR